MPQEYWRSRFCPMYCLFSILLYMEIFLLFLQGTKKNQPRAIKMIFFNLENKLHIDERTI